ncbi:MAG: hypothetical protein M0P12_00005, partial [Paludibacteraceae bacterium]|nr:hypothetical protein [Paludibacteraceae bacterium]
MGLWKMVRFSGFHPRIRIDSDNVSSNLVRTAILFNIHILYRRIQKMIPLYTEEEFNKAKSRDLLPLKCKNCGKTFYKKKHYILIDVKDGGGNFCSKKCPFEYKNPMIETTCFVCGKIFPKRKLSSEKSDKNFCCRTCANKYSSNVNKEQKTTNQKKWASSEEGQKTLSENSKTVNLRKYGILNLKKNGKCPLCGSEFTYYPSRHKTYCCRECYFKDNEHKFRRSARGGYRRGSGYGKSGWYHGFHCDSSWELAWIIYNEDHNIRFSKDVEPLSYIFDGKEHKYYPDFKMEDGTIIEIKGRKCEMDCDEKTKAKMIAFPNIKVLYKEDLCPVISYVIGKYGTDFIKMYDGKPYNKRLNKCEICGKPAISRYCSRICSGKGLSR